MAARTGRRGRRATVMSPSVRLEAGWVPRVVPKDPEVAARIKSMVAGNLLFKNLNAAHCDIIVKAMEKKTFEPEATIIKQGDAGDFFYVVDTGKCDIFVEGVGKVAEVGSGGSFGELALMYGAPRAATVVAVEATETWAVDQTTFKKTLMDATIKQRRRFEEFLKNVPILAGLDEYARLTVADALTSRVFGSGDQIITEGDNGDEFFFVESGEVKVTKAGVEGEVSRRLSTGDYFGEISLLTSQPRAATCTAVSAVTCQVLDRGTFKRLLGPLEDTLRSNMEVYEKYRDAISAAAEAKEDDDVHGTDSDGAGEGKE